MASLEDGALKSPRKRSHLNLHNSFADEVQRLFIYPRKGSYVELHFYDLPHQWGMFVIIDAVVEVVVFTSKGSETKRFLVGQNQNRRVIEIYPYELHGVECMSSSAMMLEIKEGPYSLETAIVMASF